MALVILVVAFLVGREKERQATGGVSTTRRDGIVRIASEGAPLSNLHSASSPDGRSPQDVLALEESPVQSRSYGTETVSVESFLEDYWGPDWPKIRRRIEQEGLPLDSEINLSNLSPEEVALATIADQFLLDEDDLKKREADLLERAGVGDDLETVIHSIAGGRQKYMDGFNKLDDLGKSEFEDYIASFEQSLILSAHELVSQEQALRQDLWDNQNVGFGPIYPYGWNPAPKGASVSGSSLSFNLDGWSMTVLIGPESNPAYGDAYDRFWGPLRSRNNEIFSRLRQLRSASTGR